MEIIARMISLSVCQRPVRMEALVSKVLELKLTVLVRKDSKESTVKLIYPTVI